MRLSKTQRATLEAITEKDGFLHFMPYMGRFNENAYYFPHSNMGMHVRFATVNALIEAGYVERYDMAYYSNDHRARITPAGRAALAEATHE